MSKAETRAWPLDQFLAWEERQPERYELVEGRSFLMAGVTQVHALIAANLIALLRPLLRGSPCRPAGSDLRIPIPATGNARYADVTVDCGRFDPTAHDASEPTVVFEILSKSTGWYDQTRKLRDYETVLGIRQYVCISQSETRITIWLRSVDGRFVAQEDIVDPRARLQILTDPSSSLGVGEIYEGTGLAGEP